jgi:hypothetical protein
MLADGRTGVLDRTGLLLGRFGVGRGVGVGCEKDEDECEDELDELCELELLDRVS